MTEAKRGVPESLKPYIERLRSLQSAWTALAPSGVAVAGQSIADSGRVLSQELAQLASAGNPLDAETVANLDRQLNDLKHMMGEIARSVSPSQLRSTLPQRVGPDRRGVLDLLNLMVVGLTDHPDRIAGQIGSVDYLVTLLCTGGEGKGIRHDPVTLTPEMSALCGGVEQDDESAIREIEAEFFAASNLEGERLQQEVALRTLRTRKTELGLLYFAPRILRAVVTYNATLAERLADELWESQDWGSAVEDALHAATPEREESAESASVFTSTALRDLGAALRRRASDAVPESNDLDRVAWGLDIDYAEGIERKALLRADVGTRENLLGTTILVGLINRSLVVLSIELQSIGISPDRVSDHWVPELCGILQTETNLLLGKDAYQQACVLSELKNKFLLSSTSAKPIPRRPLPATVSTSRPGAPVAPGTDAPRESARDLVRDALAEHKGSERARSARTSETDGASWFRNFPWQRTLPAIAALLILAYIGVQALAGRDLDPNLDRFGREELAEVSPHLAKGYRNGEGYGPAFVGTLDSAWQGLSPEERETAAAGLVEKLRILGVRQVMIYDADDRLRIQAIGAQPVRTL